MANQISPTALSTRLIRVSAFKETAWGTAGVPTAKWLGIKPDPLFTPKFKSTIYDEDRGALSESYLSNILEKGGAFQFNQYVTYQDAPFIFGGILQSVDPTGGSPYVWTHVKPETNAPAIQSYTLEHSYDIGTIQAAGCIINKLTIKGQAGSSKDKWWEFAVQGFYKSHNQFAAINIQSSTNANPIVVTTATAHGLPSSGAFSVRIAGHLVNTAANGIWTGTYLSPTTFSIPVAGNGVGAATGTVTETQTPGLSDRSVEVCVFPGTTLAIDAANATPGTTPFSNCFVGFEMALDPQYQEFYMADSLSPVDWTFDKYKVELTLKLLWNAQVKAMVASQYEAGNRQVFQIKQTSGSNAMELDYAGIPIDDPKFYGKELNAQVVELKFAGQYDGGALANSLKAIVSNNVSALP